MRHQFGHVQKIVVLYKVRLFGKQRYVRPVQSQSICWRQNESDSKTEKYFGKIRKLFAQREKMLVSSIVFFFHSVSIL